MPGRQKAFLVRVTNLAASIVELKDAGVEVVGTAGEATKTIFEFNQTGPFAWVLGAEGDGLRQLTRKRCSDLASIPDVRQCGKFERFRCCRNLSL